MVQNTNETQSHPTSRTRPRRSCYQNACQSCTRPPFPEILLTRHPPPELCSERPTSTSAANGGGGLRAERRAITPRVGTPEVLTPARRRKKVSYLQEGSTKAVLAPPSDAARPVQTKLSFGARAGDAVVEAIQSKESGGDAETEAEAEQGCAARARDVLSVQVRRAFVFCLQHAPSQR